MAIPCPISSWFCRCSGVASRSLGNHSSGTVSERPSSRWITNASATNSIARARGPGGLATEVLIPPLQEEGFMCERQLAQTPKLGGAEVEGVLDTHRFEPDLRGSASLVHVDVRGLHPIARVERE